MTLFVNEAAQCGNGKPVVLDDMILTTALPTTAGSKMLENYRSLFDATVVKRLEAAGYCIAGKANVGEFGFDVLGESSYFGASMHDETPVCAANELLEQGAAVAAIGLDINGAPRRGAAFMRQVCIKPTYGTVSRFGTIGIACSGETVSITAKDSATCQEVLDVLASHDDNDGTSLPEGQCAQVRSNSTAAAKPIKRLGISHSLTAHADAPTQVVVKTACQMLESQGIQLVDIDEDLLSAARPAWNILMAAELCNNVSRFDGVKYGYRSKDFETIGQLYTNSRTEAFGLPAKLAILFGSEVLSEANYDALYDKALRVRRVLVEHFAQLFTECDAIALPASQCLSYQAQDLAAAPSAAFTQNLHSAPASITGLPAVIAGGVQFVGPAFSDTALLQLAARFEKEA